MNQNPNFAPRARALGKELDSLADPGVAGRVQICILDVDPGSAQLTDEGVQLGHLLRRIEVNAEDIATFAGKRARAGATKGAGCAQNESPAAVELAHARSFGLR